MRPAAWPATPPISQLRLRIVSGASVVGVLRVPSPSPSHALGNAAPRTVFLAAVKATGKKQLIIAGIVTEVCVAFPALSAREAGYEVFIVTDASGTFNKTTRDAAWCRMQAAGCQLLTWFGAACELHRDWRNDIEGLGALFSNHLPNYRCLITSYMAGQAAASR